MKNRKSKKNKGSILVCAAGILLVSGMMTGCSASSEKQTGTSIPNEESAEYAEENTEEVSNQPENETIQLEQMAGKWMIDFDRTDASLWGSGISYGNRMELSETGEFSYYIGIGVGGTGQCEEKNGEISVEIQPYEEHSSEKEILALKYVNDNGEEYILMNWHEEDVYWEREGTESVDE